MGWYGSHPDRERQDIANFTSARERAWLNVGSWDPYMFSQGAGIARTAPWARPGMVLGLTRAGAPPDAVHRMTALSAFLNSRRNPSGRGPLDPVTGAQINPGDRRLFDEMNRRKASYAQAKQYVGNLMRQGAREKATQALRDDGLIGDDDILQSPASIDEINAYKRNPEQYLRQRPHEGAKIQRFMDFATSLGGDIGKAISPYGGPLPRNTFQEVPFRMPDGRVGMWRPPSNTNNGIAYEPEPGVQRRRLLETAGSVAASAITESPQVQGAGEAVSWLAGNRPALFDPTGGADVEEAGFTGGLRPLGAAAEAVAEPAGAALEPLSRVRVPQATFVPGVAESQSMGPTGATSVGDIAQYGFAALDLPYQEAQGMIRNIYGSATGRSVDWWEPQSDFAIMLTGRDPGGGFFINNESEVADERRRREAERGMIYGQRVTFGRIIAAGAVELGLVNPDDRNYRVLSGLVDGAFALYADPTAIAAGKLAKVSEARSVFAAEALPDIPEHLTDILGIKGLSRTETAARVRMTDVAALKSREIKSIARTLNIPNRNMLSAADLRAAVTEALPASVIPQGRQTTGVLRGMLTPSQQSRIVRPLAERAGALKGSFIDAVHGPTAEAFFQGRVGSALVKALADTDDAGSIYFLLNGRLNYRELKPFKEARTTAEVEEALRPFLGKEIRSTRDLWRAPAWGPKYQLSRDVKSWLIREAGDMPNPHVDMTDDQQMIPTLVDFLRNSNVSDTDQFRLIDAMVGSAGDDLATLKVWEDAVQTTLAKVHGDRARKYGLSKGFFNEYERARNWLTQDAAEPRLFDDMVVGGKTVPVGNTNSFAQLAHAVLPLPDIREMRRLSGHFDRVTKLLDSKVIKAPEQWALWLQDNIWKPATLLRFAWAMRVIPEEQLRIAARGHASLFKDPAGMIAFLVGHKKTITGELFEDLEEFKKVVHQSAGWMLGDRPGLVQAGHRINLQRSDDGYIDAVMDEFRQLSRDDVAPDLVRATSYQEGANRFIDGDLTQRLVDQRNPRWEHPAGRQELVENTMRHIKGLTKDDPELLEVIRSGKFRGKDVFTDGKKFLATEYRKPGFSKEFERALRNEKFDNLPMTIQGPETIEASYKEARNADFVNWMFRQLMGRETAYLSRSPEFRQAYFDRVQELIQHGTPQAKDEILGQFEAQFGRRRTAGIRGTTARGELTVTDIDNLAKSYAIDDVKSLLYDLQKKSQLADQMRLISPFAEAWKEVVTRWADLAFNPTRLGRSAKNLHRFDQVVGAARGQDLGEVTGAPQVWDKEKERFIQGGFFWKDEFGEEAFNYPGGQWITGIATKLMPGVPEVAVPLTGRVQGLNMIGQVFPGIGPIAQIPVAAILADKPGWQRTLRGALLPFGSAADAEGMTAWFDALNSAPPWMKAGVQALAGTGYSGATNRLWANAEMAAANYLYSTGRYDTSTESGQAALKEDAQDAARALYGVKALVAFGAPTSPRIDWLVKTDNQGMVRLAMLRDDYYRMVADDPKTADDLFMERWGDSVGMTMQAYTREVQGGIGVSKEWGDWANTGEAKRLKAKYPATWAFHGPQGGEFDYDTYLRQILGGQREQLGLDEWFALGQHHLGSMLMDQARDKVAALIAAGEGTASDYGQWLHDWEDYVYDQYPGFAASGQPAGTVSRYEREDVMRELARAMQDKTYTSSTFGASMKEYWDRRMQSIDAAKEAGLRAYGPEYSLQSAERLAGHRAWLFEWGTYLADQDESFKGIWNRYLRSEVEPSREEQAALEEEAA